MAFEISWQRRGVIVRFSGILTAAESNSANDQIYANPLSDDLNYIIWDLSKIEGHSMRDDHIEYLAAIDCAAASSIKRTVKIGLVAHKPEIKQLWHIYMEYARQLGTPWQYKITNSEKALREWIKS